MSGDIPNTNHSWGIHGNFTVVEGHVYLLTYDPVDKQKMVVYRMELSTWRWQLLPQKAQGPERLNSPATTMFQVRDCQCSVSRRLTSFCLTASYEARVVPHTPSTCARTRTVVARYYYHHRYVYQDHNVHDHAAFHVINVVVISLAVIIR